MIAELSAIEKATQPGDATILLAKSITLEFYFAQLWHHRSNPECAFSKQIESLLDRFIALFVSCLQSSQGNYDHRLSSPLRHLLQLRASSIPLEQASSFLFLPLMGFFISCDSYFFTFLFFTCLLGYNYISPFLFSSLALCPALSHSCLWS